MKKVFIFLSGLTIGAAGGYFITKKIIENKTDNEIKSVIDSFKKRTKNLEEKLDESNNNSDSEKEDDIKKELDKLKNTFINIETPSDEDIDENENEESNLSVDTVNDNYLDEDDEDEEPYFEDDQLEPPHLISPEEYGEYDDLEPVTYIYYADHILVDNDKNIISDPTEIVGNLLDKFNDNKTLAIQVRNEEMGNDIEIIKSDLKYTDVYYDPYYEEQLETKHKIEEKRKKMKEAKDKEDDEEE